MPDAPTIYLSNWSSHRTPGHHGPGRKLTIMARPRHWERGWGAVAEVRPNAEAIVAMKEGRLSEDDYFAQYRHGLEVVKGRGGLIPGELIARSWVDGDGMYPGGNYERVMADSTLCCSCARGKRCHRVILAEFLRVCGWRVILDGEAIE